MTNLIKLFVTIVIFYVLSTYIDLENFLQIVQNSKIGFLLLALLMQLLSTIFASYRWMLIMHELVFKENFSFYLRSYFKGTFFNQVLPSSIGGDAFRVIELAQKGYGKRDSFYGILVDRVIGLLGLVILNFAFSIMFNDIFPDWLYEIVYLIAFVAIAGFTTLLYVHKLTYFEKYKITDIFLRLSKRLSTLYASKKLLNYHLFLTVLVHLFSIFSIYFISCSIGLNLDMQTLIIATPLVFLLTIIPISLAGWGIRESSFVGILLLVGATKESVLALSIIYGIILIITALPGSYFWVKSKKTT